MEHEASGSLFIVAAPSGGGKTSLVNKVVQSLDNIEVSISHTTRKPRPKEEDGADYFFVSQPIFEDMIKKKAFLEYAQVYKEHYGTSIAQVNHRLSQGIDVLLDIDWQGAQQVKKAFPGAITVFIIPPSLAILEQRLQDRRQDDLQVIDQRMKQAKDELSHFAEFDYLIVNDDFTIATEELRSVIIANRLTRARQEGKHAKLLSFLLASQ